MSAFVKKNQQYIMQKFHVVTFPILPPHKIIITTTNTSLSGFLGCSHKVSRQSAHFSWVVLLYTQAHSTAGIENPRKGKSGHRDFNLQVYQRSPTFSQLVVQVLQRAGWALVAFL